MNHAGLDQILSQCARLMAKKGYHGTSMRDLAQTTGRSLSGLYHYFENKEQLLYLINQRGFSSLLQTARTLRDQNLPPARQLHALIEQHVAYFAGHLNEMRVMMFGTLELSRGRKAEVRQLKDDYTRLFAQAVAEHCESLAGTPLSGAALSRKTYLLFGMMNWIFGWYSKTQHGDLQVLVDDIHQTFSGGLQHPPSQEEVAA